MVQTIFLSTVYVVTIPKQRLEGTLPTCRLVNAYTYTNKSGLGVNSAGMQIACHQLGQARSRACNLLRNKVNY